MKRFLAIAFLLSAVGCTENRWGLLYDGRYTSADRVEAYAKEHHITYKEAFQKLHSNQDQMWDEVNQHQQQDQAYKQPPTGAVEAQQVDRFL